MWRSEILENKRLLEEQEKEKQKISLKNKIFLP